jgi:hypothetical protein
MNNNLIIKYNPGRKDLVEGEFYEIKFDYKYFYGLINDLINDLSMGSLNYYHDTIEYEIYIKELQDKNIIMKYIGLSRIDGLDLFIIDRTQIKRDNIIEEILKI